MALLHAKFDPLSAPDGCGVVAVVYSVLATAGVERIRQQMDRREGTLVAAHGYCTQELVNLLITGAHWPRTSQGLAKDWQKTGKGPVSVGVSAVSPQLALCRPDTAVDESP